jgi:hypothetical protein
LLSTPRLEVLRVAATHGVAWAADEINPSPLRLRQSGKTDTDPHPVWRAIMALPGGLFRFIRSMFLSWHSLDESREMTEQIREGTKDEDAR